MSMKSIINAKEFASALGKISKVLKNSRVPATSEIFVRFQSEQCILVATDLTTWLTMRVPTCGDEFAFVLPRGKDLERICRLLEGELTLTLNEQIGGHKKKGLRLLMTCGSRSGEFEVHPPENYFEMVPVESETEFTVDAGKLLACIERVRYAAAKQAPSTRPSVSCVQFYKDLVYAIDGYRMACDRSEDLCFPPVMVCGEALSYLKLLDGPRLTFQMGDRWITVTDGTADVQLRRVKAEMYEPEKAEYNTKAPREEFFISPKEVIRELTYLKDSAPKLKRHLVRFRNGELFMPLHESKYSTSIGLDGHCEITFAFELAYLMDAMQQFKAAPLVKVKVFSALEPIIIEADGRSDYALVCPARLSSLMAA